MRADAGIEDRIVFENLDGGFYGVESSAPVRKDSPTSHQRTAKAGAASVKILEWNISRTTVNDERGFQVPARSSNKSITANDGERPDLLVLLRRKGQQHISGDSVLHADVSGGHDKQSSRDDRARRAHGAALRGNAIHGLEAFDGVVLPQD